MARVRIALATCEDYPELTGDDRLLQQALRRAGIEAVPAIWTDQELEWERFDAVVIRNTWDYFAHLKDFQGWLRYLKRLRVPVFNPVDTLLGNLDKVYMRDLAARGVPQLPTLWITPENRAAAASEIKAHPELTEDLIVKPTVSAGAYGLIKTTRSALVADPTPLDAILAKSNVMIQPFVPEIASDGEWSFMFFNGRFSHAVVKAPKAGDFRVQFTHGGSHRKVEAPEALLSAARAVLEQLEEPLLYARVDGLVYKGQFVLMELELLEPFLFFEEDPESPDRFVEAFMELVR